MSARRAIGKAPLAPTDKHSRLPHCVVRGHFYLSKPIVAKKPDFSRFSTKELSTNSLLDSHSWPGEILLGPDTSTPLE